MNYTLRCRICKKQFDHDFFRCPACGGVLECDFDLSDQQHLRHVLQNARGFWDYSDFFPIRTDHIVSIGEGETPLVYAKNLCAELGMQGVYIKNEGQNPTGTFKDRPLSVGYTKAVELQAEATIIGSAGNAGAAAAAYAAASGIRCFVLLPEFTAMERVAQTLRYGAHAIKIRGNVSDCIDMLNTVCARRNWHNMSTAVPCNPFQAEGSKTIAYELARQLDWMTPDWVIIPIGGGGNLASIYKGYCDLKKLGLIDRVPKMVGVQEESCAAVAQAYAIHAAPDQIKRVENPSGVAVAIQDALPLDGSAALQAIYDSGGIAMSVSASQIADAQSLLGRTTGIFAEPASACTVAALTRLKGDGRILKTEKVVCLVTGNGLKDTGFAIAHSVAPDVVDMDEQALDRVIDRYISM